MLTVPLGNGCSSSWKSYWATSTVDHWPQTCLHFLDQQQRIIIDQFLILNTLRLTITANVKPLEKFLILQLYYNSFYTSFEIC
jgi:hypothetical protein